MIDSSAHTLAPVSLLCTDFIKCLLITDNEEKIGKSTMKPTAAKDEETEESEDDDDDDDYEDVNEKILARKTHLDKVKDASSLNNLDNIENEGKFRRLLNEKIDLKF